VPCYNYGHYLANTLESLLAQSWQFWECIIVDDGSNDNTMQVATSFANQDVRFHYIHQRNQGLSAARNTGIRTCKGSYIQFLDADDMLEAKKMELQLSYLEQHHDVDIVYGNVRYFNEQASTSTPAQIDEQRIIGVSNVSGSGKEILHPLIQGNIMVVNAPLIRKKVLEDVGWFKQHLSGYEDWDYWIRCAISGKRFQYLNEDNTLALVRVHKSSMSHNILPMLMSHIEIREQLQQTLLHSDLRKENDYRIGLVIAKIAQFEFANGDMYHGLHHAILAIWRSHVNYRIILYLFAPLLPEKVAKELKSILNRLHVLP
jgi:glycosyltransferase involved in cell wall biosynthesis